MEFKVSNKFSSIMRGYLSVDDNQKENYLDTFFECLLER